MTFEHLHQGHKEDTCLIQSASPWMTIKPRSGKRLDEWSRCVPDGSRFLTTGRNTDWYRHIWMDRWTRAFQADVKSFGSEHSDPKAGLEETVSVSSQAYSDTKRKRFLSPNVCSSRSDISPKTGNQATARPLLNPATDSTSQVGQRSSPTCLGSQLGSYCKKSGITTVEIL